MLGGTVYYYVDMLTHYPIEPPVQPNVFLMIGVELATTILLYINLLMSLLPKIRII